MSLRPFFSRLFSPRKNKPHVSNRNEGGHHQRHTWWHYIVRFLIVVAMILSAVWLLMAIWYQFGAQSPITWMATTVIVGLLTALLSIRYWSALVSSSNKQIFNNKKPSKWLAGCYAIIWLIGAGWFVSITPQQQRDWQPDVNQMLSYQRDASNPDLITFTNVRNFDWKNEDEATEHWETRTVDMSKLSGVDIINSYWMGPLIAHTLVSFRFEDDRPLSLSLEIRKEKGEKFSALGGFFKRFELILIASEERDIIYTRTNARGEQVYLFPISHLQQSEVKSLFESYLTAADELNVKPAWYNTLTSNCTNIIFYMARIVSGDRLPWDYRIWVSGWLPNYLYDIGMLNANPEKNKPLKRSVATEKNGQTWSMDKWYEQAHINPKVVGFDNQSTLDTSHNSIEFSNQIRQGIPIPALADSKTEADAQAKSAIVSLK